MPIKEIGLISFRNHDEIKLKFCPNINVIWGKNGSGKTAILEAIHILSIGRSFRTNRKNELLKEGKDYFSITAKFKKNSNEQTVQINQTNDGMRRIIVDDNKIDNIRQLIGLNSVVLLSPEEQIITNGTPQDQRNYFNKLFSIISTDYLNTLFEYSRIIKQRNKLLSDFHLVKSADDELAVWNDQISDVGIRLWKSKKTYLNKFFHNLEIVIEKFPDSSFSLCCETTSKATLNKDEYLEILNKFQNKDIYLGRTSFGPHNDKLDFIFNGKNIKQYGSQGEHKFTLLLIKLTEVEFFKEQTKQDPIILLDDLFAKLDDVRSKQAIEMIGKDLQTIITTTDLKIIEDRGVLIDAKKNSSVYLS